MAGPFADLVNSIKLGLCTPVPAPKTPLGFHRIQPTKGRRESIAPSASTAMNFGDAWAPFMGKCTKGTTFEILDYFFQAGGNLIDTSTNYQGVESEQWIGEWMASRKNRDQIVLATKIDYQGNHSKSLRTLGRRQPQEVGHRLHRPFVRPLWDFSTSIEEVIQSLHQPRPSPERFYIGVSDTPAWIASSANRWSAADREFERDILPMAVWRVWRGALGSGIFKSAGGAGEYPVGGAVGGLRFGQAARRGGGARKGCEAQRHGHHVGRACLCLAQGVLVFSIVGGRKVEHLKGNIAALSLELTEENIAEIEDAAPFDIGFR
ncbi:NADP-dependent oxidoreductase domain-containing protein [Zopfochytrium polystomum]|nr:NADP-dependent oxidoreductase domain-containing protein [Zopfochytrium polystomum]